MSFSIPKLLAGYIYGTGPCVHSRQKVRDLGLGRQSVEDDSVFYCARPYCQEGICQWPDMPNGKNHCGTLSVTIDEDPLPIALERVFDEPSGTWKWRPQGGADHVGKQQGVTR